MNWSKAPAAILLACILVTAEDCCGQFHEDESLRHTIPGLWLSHSMGSKNPSESEVASSIPPALRPKCSVSCLSTGEAAALWRGWDFLVIFSRSVLGCFPVFWVRWFYLRFAMFWSFDLFFAWYSQHFGVWIFHLLGLCSILALPRRQSFCGKVIRNRNRNLNQYCPL